MKTWFKLFVEKAIFIALVFICFTGCKRQVSNEFDVKLNYSETDFYDLANETFNNLRERGCDLYVDILATPTPMNNQNEYLFLYIDSNNHIFPYSNTYSSDKEFLSDYIFDYVVSEDENDSSKGKYLILLPYDSKCRPFLEKLKLLFQIQQDKIYNHVSMGHFDSKYENLSIDEWEQIEDKYKLNVVIHPPFVDYVNQFDKRILDKSKPLDLFRDVNKIAILVYADMCVVDDSIEVDYNNLLTCLNDVLMSAQNDTVIIELQSMRTTPYDNYIHVYEKVKSIDSNDKHLIIKEKEPKLN